MEVQVQASAEIKSRGNDSLRIEIEIPLLRSMLNGEEVIQYALNAAGVLASQELLKNL